MVEKLKSHMHTSADVNNILHVSNFTLQPIL